MVSRVFDTLKQLSANWVAIGLTHAPSRRPTVISSRNIMKKADLIDMVADMAGTTKVMAGQIVEGLFDTIAGEMAKGNSVDIAGFGKFAGQHRAARTARNPRTGDSVMVPAQMVPKFKAAKGLKDTVKG